MSRLRRWWKRASRAERASYPPDVIRRAVRNAFALGSLWSVVALLLFPGADASKQVLLTCLISGMLSGGAFALSPIPQAALAYVAVIVPAAVAALLLNAGGPLVIATILLLLYAFVLARSIIWNSHLFVQHVVDQAKLEEAARTDPLTGLINRAGLRQTLEEACLNANTSFALAFMDLDRFKNVNDSRGHRVGDAVLKTVAARLKVSLDETDTVARVGGDEFVILLRNASKPDEARQIARRLIDKASEPIIVEGRSLSVGGSIGIAMAPKSGADPDDLLNKADLALYRAKAAGGQSTKLFDNEMSAEARNRRVMEIDLRQALRDGEFRIDYQPIFNVNTRAVTGCEALLRWKHPIDGLLPPSSFIPLAEETGLIGEIGEWVLTEATLAAVRWPGELYVAVNLSPVQLKTQDVVAATRRALSAAGLSPGRLMLEITESVFVEDAESMLSAMLSLQQIGVRTALDDFGTGYSSLGYLRRFRFDKLKVDRTFVRGIDTGREARDIVRTIVSLARNLNMTTIAEGVERPEELRELIAEGCTEAQGFLLARPVAAEDILHVLTKDLRSAA